MAVLQSTLISGTGTTSVSSATTASVTPTANALQLLVVASKVSTGQPNAPTITGNGLTWVRIGGNWHSSTYKVNLFRAQGSSPTAGSITIDFAGQTQSGVSWQLSEFTNVKTSGVNGAHAVRQSISANSSGNVTSISIAMNNFGYIDNASYGVCHVGRANTSPTVGSGFTQIGSATNSGGCRSEWKNTNDTSIDWTLASSNCCAIGVEIVEQYAPSGEFTLIGAGNFNASG